ncbi:MAG: adenylate kinase [Clostridia bacterium]|nr:adenylate kinase [Clostridia bacterium]
MIIIITGATHAGKTLLSQKLIDKFRYPCLSIDHLKMGLIRAGCTELTPEDDRELTGYLFPIVKEMIRTAIENGQNMIVEGCYIPFDFRSLLGKEYAEHVKFLCLALSDKYIDGHFGDIIRFESVTEKRIVDPCLTPEFCKRENRFYEKGFREKGERVELIEDDFEAELLRIVEAL